MVKIAQNQHSHLVFMSLQAFSGPKSILNYMPLTLPAYSLKYIEYYCTCDKNGNLYDLTANLG